MTAPIRAFLALEPPADVQAELAETMAKKVPRGVRLRLLPSESIHLTVRFLGETPNDILTPLRSEMDLLGAMTRPADVHIGDLAPFPVRRPTVVAAEVEPTEPLGQLAEGVEGIATKLGFESDRRPFRPHITVARVPRHSKRIPGFTIPIDLTFRADELVLFESLLSPEGAQYRRLHVTRLRG